MCDKLYMEYISEEKLKTVSKSIWSFLLAGMLLLVGFAVAGEHFYSSLADTAGNSVQVSQENAETVFSDPSQYSSIILKDHIDMSGITLKGKPNSSSNFTGVLDGNGFSISNLSFEGVDGSNNVGLIPAANGATIQNLRISGSVSFNFSQTDNSIVNVGLLVGKAFDTTISNCEIAVDNITLDFSKNSANVGLIAGSADLCQISDVVVKGGLDVKVDQGNTFNIGGLVGAFSSSSISRSIFFGSISTSKEQDSSQEVFVGGLLGFAQGDSKIKDNGSSATLTSTFAVQGGLIGQVSSNSAVASYNLNYCYWTGADLPAVGSNGQQYGKTDTLTSISGLSHSFLLDSQNFDPSSTGFDFDLVFGVADTEIVLQRFQTFSFSFNDTLNDYIEKPVFVVDGEEKEELTSVAYGKKIKIKLEITKLLDNGYSVENLVEYLEVQRILVSNSSVDIHGYNITSNAGENAFEIDFAANGTTAGSYSFEIFAKSYQCEFVAAKDGQVLPGGVTFSGIDPVESRSQSLTVESAKTTIMAVASGYYTFDHWNLYYRDQNGQWKTEPEANWENSDFGVNSTLASLPISFGIKPFDQAFKLEAVFSSENGIAIDFVNFNSDHIALVKVQGNTYNNQPVIILRTLTNAIIEVVMNEGYEFDSHAFVRSLQTMYNQAVAVEEVVTQSQNSDGQNVYTLKVDVAKICENGDEGFINFSLPSKVADNGSGNNLLWLWITLPCVIVAAGVAVFLIVYFKKRSQARANVKKKEKEVSYKDFYM